MQSKLSLLGVLVIAAGLLLGVEQVSVGAYYITTPYAFSLGTANQFAFTGDGAPTLLRDGTDVYLIGRDAPASPGHPVIYKGTSWDSLTQVATGVLDASYTTANGERYWWNGGGWIDGTGKWYVVTHIEFDFGQTQPPLSLPPMKRIGLSSSTDKGLHWHYEGDIMTSDNSYNINDFHNYFDYGVGEPNLYVDNTGGYFYVWYLQLWSSTTNGADWFSSLRVARSPISGHMAPGTWNYFYNGAWIQNALGGLSSDVLPNATSSNVVFSTYLNRFVLITSRLVPGNPLAGAYMATATDLSQQNWTNFVLLSNTTNHYNTITNSTGDGTGTVGQSMRWYTTGFGPGPGQYQMLTFGTGSQPALGMPQQYLPTYSVHDANPYWDWTVTPRASSFTDNFTASTPVGWTTYDGNWSESGGQLHVDSGPDNGAAVQNNWFDNLTYDVDVSIATTTGDAGLVLRNANNDYGANNYRGYYVGFSGSQLALAVADNTSGTPSSLAYLATDPITTSANQLYHLRVIAHSGRIEVFFNGAGAPSIDVIDSDFSFGGIGLRAHNTAAAYANLSVVSNSDLSAYTFSDNLTSTQGSNGWRYQQTSDDVNFSDMTWQTTTQQWKGTCDFNLIWVPFYIHPDCNDSVVTWIAPKAGYVTITGNVRKYAAGGDGVNVKILQNAGQVWPSSGWQFIAGTDTTGVNHEVSAVVAQGDAIRFLVNKNGTRDSDATVWNPTIEYVSARLGVVLNNSEVYVKEGALNAAWTDEGPGFSVALSGSRIGKIGTDNHAYVKEGSLTAPWVDEGPAVSIQLSGDRIAIQGQDQHLYVKEGPLAAAWTDEASSISGYAVSGERIGVVTFSSEAYVKEGALDAAWTDEASNVAQIALAGNRIGVLLQGGSGEVDVKEGALNAAWMTEATGQTQVALAESRIAVLSTNGTLNVKDGALNASWVTEGTGWQQVTLSGIRILARNNSFNADATEGSLTNAVWQLEASNVAGGVFTIALPENRPT